MYEEYLTLLMLLLQMPRKIFFQNKILITLRTLEHLLFIVQVHMFSQPLLRAILPMTKLTMKRTRILVCQYMRLQIAIQIERLVATLERALVRAVQQMVLADVVAQRALAGVRARARAAAEGAALAAVRARLVLRARRRLREPHPAVPALQRLRHRVREPLVRRLLPAGVEYLPAMIAAEVAGSVRVVVHEEICFVDEASVASVADVVSVVVVRHVFGETLEAFKLFRALHAL